MNAATAELGGVAPSLDPVSGDGVEEAGGQEAFAAFHRATARPLWAYLMRSSGDPDLADDLLQEAYYRYLRSGFTAESDAHARSYLYRVATNLLRDYGRHRTVQRRSGEVEPRPPTDDAAPAPQAVAPGDPAGAAQQRRDLERCMAELEPRDRRLLWLAHVEGASHREMAAILEVAEASVRVLVFRARQRLVARLRERGLGPEESR